MLDTPSCVYGISYITQDIFFSKDYKRLHYLCNPLADTYGDSFVNALLSLPQKPMDFIENLNIRVFVVDDYFFVVMEPK